MEAQPPHRRKWFTRRRLVVFTCLVLLPGFIGGIWIFRPRPLLREVEAVGGTYADQSLNFQSRMTITNWTRVPRRLLQIAQGKRRRYFAIEFKDTDITDDWAQQNEERLKSLPVFYIGFHGTKITDETVTHLAGMKRLITLDLSRTSITDRSLSTLRQIPNLQHIDLSDTNVTADGISQLVDLRPNKLDISGDVLTDESVNHLNLIPYLSMLRLNDFTNDQLSCLNGMKKLDLLVLRGATDQSLPAILQLSQLQHLCLEDSQLSEKSLETIRKTFPNLHISQQNSYKKFLKFGIHQKWAAQQRLKRKVYTAVAIALGGGCFILLIVMLLRRRRSRRQQISLARV